MSRRPGGTSAPSLFRQVSSFTLFSSGASSEDLPRPLSSPTKPKSNLSFPFRRRESSPHSDDDYANVPNSPSNSRFMPVWKSNGGRQGIDGRKIAQLVGGLAALVTVVVLISKLFGGTSGRKDPFEIVERTPTTNFFQDYEGGLECRLSSLDLYKQPVQNTPQEKSRSPYCASRGQLLSAMSGGGRSGFEQPYEPNGCSYKWYSTEEICMILDRFDGIVFVGDDMVAQIYAAFNALLRRNIRLGALEQWRMLDRELETCACDRQYTNPECSKYFATSSEEIAKHDSEGGPMSPYACNRVPHMYFPIAGTANPDYTSRFRELLDAKPHSWKPVATIHSLGLSTSFNWQTATESLDEWLTIADASGRNSPFVWLGPNAAGHLKPPSKIMQEGNNALWHYSLMLGSEATKRNVDHLNFYNMTLQASSWDGSSYGESVNLVQAMMIINWLARLEST